MLELILWVVWLNYNCKYLSHAFKIVYLFWRQHSEGLQNFRQPKCLKLKEFVSYAHFPEHWTKFETVHVPFLHLL